MGIKYLWMALISILIFKLDLNKLYEPKELHTNSKSIEQETQLQK